MKQNHIQPDVYSISQEDFDHVTRPQQAKALVKHWHRGIQLLEASAGPFMYAAQYTIPTLEEHTIHLQQKQERFITSLREADELTEEKMLELKKSMDEEHQRFVVECRNLVPGQHHFSMVDPTRDITTQLRTLERHFHRMNSAYHIELFTDVRMVVHGLKEGTVVLQSKAPEMPSCHEALKETTTVTRISPTWQRTEEIKTLEHILRRLCPAPLATREMLLRQMDQQITLLSRLSTLELD